MEKHKIWEFNGEETAIDLFDVENMELYEEGLIDSSFGGGFETIDGCALLNCSGDSDYPEAVRDAILAEAQRLCRDGIDEEQFLRLKRSTLGHRIRRLDSFDASAFALSACHFSGFSFTSKVGIRVVSVFFHTSDSQ